MPEPRLTFDGIDLSGVGVKLDATAVAIGFRYDQIARERDAYARRLLEDRMPQFLHFLIDRPKALRQVLRVVPRWRPTMTVVDLWRPTHPLSPPADMLPPAGVMTGKAACELARTWLSEMRAADKSIPTGLIFTYTDVNGMPAELHGV